VIAVKSIETRVIPELRLKDILTLGQRAGKVEIPEGVTKDLLFGHLLIGVEMWQSFWDGKMQ